MKSKQPTYETRFTGNRVGMLDQAEVIVTGVDGSVKRTIILVGSIMELCEKYPKKK